jgi:hypothetical protein
MITWCNFYLLFGGNELPGTLIQAGKRAVDYDAPLHNLKISEEECQELDDISEAEDEQCKAKES